MVERANITPVVLKWARETAKMSEAEASSKVSVNVEKLQEWESGISMPTIIQAQKLAKSYKRPFAILFLPEPPKDFHPLQDFRKKGSNALSTSSIFIIREIQQKQAWISEDIKNYNETKLDFVGKFTIKDNPKVVAKHILTTLKINPFNYTTNNPMKEWILKAESEGIFVSRTSFIHTRLPLNIEEIQGFAIADNYAPFIFVNSADWLSPQLFTLIHELAHIWIGQSSISNFIDSELKERNKYHPVELFCNEVAANALIPEEFILNLPKNVFNFSEEVFNISKKLGVSSFSFIVRALNLEIITQHKYLSLKKESDIAFQAFLKKEAEKKIKQKKNKGGPSPYLLRLNRNSRLFTQIVLDGFYGGRIEPNLASNLLNVKSNKFRKLEDRFYI